jgi:hypothetical protein
MESAVPVASRIAGKQTRSFVTGNTFATGFKADTFLFDWASKPTATMGPDVDVGTRMGPFGHAPGYREEHRPSTLGDGRLP